MIKKVLFDKKGRKYYWEKGNLSTSFGLIKEEDMPKNEAVSNTSQKFQIFDANFIDNLERIKTGPATAHIKDIGSILAYSGIDKGSIVAEAGTGSGFLTAILSRFVKKVCSYEIKKEFYDLSKKNLERLDIKNVELFNESISNLKGIFDLIILDFLDPWNYNVEDNLKNGSYLVAYLSNIKQVEEFVRSSSLFHERTMEIIQREWYPTKFRPKNSVIGHSAFLVFMRK